LTSTANPLVSIYFDVNIFLDKDELFLLFGQYDNKKPSLQGDVDRLLEEGLDENVESFLSQDDMDPRDSLGRCMDASKGMLFYSS
jgi:hypothetical protein